MVEKLTLESERYSGNFTAELKSKKCYTELDIDVFEYEGYFYECAAVVEDKKTNEKYFFQFRTNHFGSPSFVKFESKTLEQLIANGKDNEIVLKHLVANLILSEDKIPFLEI